MHAVALVLFAAVVSGAILLARRSRAGLPSDKFQLYVTRATMVALSVLVVLLIADMKIRKDPEEAEKAAFFRTLQEPTIEELHQTLEESHEIRMRQHEEERARLQEETAEREAKEARWREEAKALGID